MRSVAFASVAAVFVVGAVQSASAADIPARVAPRAPVMVPVFSWTGWYAGFNVGWGWNDDNGLPYCINPGGVSNGLGCVTTNVPGAQVDADGVLGGVQLGYNWQVNQAVFGVEADIQASDIGGSLNIPGPFPIVGFPGLAGTAFTASHKLDWFGTLRGRLGYTFGTTLLYATGGLAYGNVKVAQNTVFPGIAYPGTDSSIEIGWVAGAGIEHAFGNNWSARIEGLYYDLGEVDVQGGGVPVPDGFIGGKTFATRGAIVRGGLNFRFTSQ